MKIYELIMWNFSMNLKERNEKGNARMCVQWKMRQQNWNKKEEAILMPSR